MYSTQKEHCERHEAMRDMTMTVPSASTVVFEWSGLSDCSADEQTNEKPEPEKLKVCFFQQQDSQLCQMSLTGQTAVA